MNYRPAVDGSVVQLAGRCIRSYALAVAAAARYVKAAATNDWLGLATWGIRTFHGSQDQYHRSVDLYYARLQGRRASSREFDGEAQAESDLVNWHSGLPAAPPEFPRETTFALSRIEAVYLREQVLRHCSRSLLAHILRERIEIENVFVCWDLPDPMPDRLREQLEHGRSFSEAIWGAQLLYNLMLAEQCPSPERIAEYEDLLSQWWRLIDSRRAALAAWDVGRFWQIVRTANPRVNHRAQAFINQWIGLVRRSAHRDDIVGNQGRELVDQREHALKRNQSRLHNRRALERWNGAAGAAQLDLRWIAARRILIDILSGLEEQADA